jgi:proteasome assembly chaperone (PAC2) family protein
MADDSLKIYERPKMNSPRLVMGLTGWMDGGEVSSGTIECLIEACQGRKIAEIDPDPYYIMNFPGPMEISSLFRPHVQYAEGLIKKYLRPTNTFYADPENHFIFFVGREPHLKWRDYTENVFSLVAEFGVKVIYFVGSYAGLVPHTREPKIVAAVSDENLKDQLLQFNLKFSNYQGPSGISTYLLKMARQRELSMTNLVAEIPAYVQGRNPKCIEAVTRRLAVMLNLDINIDNMRRISDDYERRLTKVIKERTELAEHITKLEEHYDKEIFDTEMTDLKHFLIRQGIRLD